jgi:dTDP-4-amino-4,6-dideoxygalactose transaminase
MNIPLVKNTINKEDIDKLIEWLKTYPRLTKGNLTIEFESLWSKFMGVKHSIFVNSGSSANLLMVYALIEAGLLKIGDNIIIPSLSWSTSLSPAIQLGLNPILCDCNKEDLSVDMEHLESLIINNDIKCLMIVPILGLVPQMDKIIRHLILLFIIKDSKCSISTDKSSLLQSHKIGFKPSCIAGDRLVDQDSEGIIILSPIFRRPASIKA